MLMQIHGTRTLETGVCCLGYYCYSNRGDVYINALKGDSERGLSVERMNASVIFYTSESC